VRKEREQGINEPHAEHAKTLL